MTMHLDVFYPALNIRSKRKLGPFGWRCLLIGAAIVAAAGGFLTGFQDAASTRISIEHELLILLRFMAVLKLGAAVAGATLAYWRLGSPVSSGLAAALIAASAFMAAAPGLIWSNIHVGVGALLFYIGLFTFLGSALKDTTAWIKPGKKRG